LLEGLRYSSGQPQKRKDEEMIKTFFAITLIMGAFLAIFLGPGNFLGIGNNLGERAECATDPDCVDQSRPTVPGQGHRAPTMAPMLPLPADAPRSVNLVKCDGEDSMVQVDNPPGWNVFSEHTPPTIKAQYFGDDGQWHDLGPGFTTDNAHLLRYCAEFDMFTGNMGLSYERRM